MSSLGHSVLVPAFIGGSWKHLVTESSSSTSETSPYLAFIVALHVATAIALLIFFRADWLRIIRGFLRSVRPSLAARRVVTRDADERLAWLIIIATIPVGITGLALEHTFRTLFAKPLAAAIFLTVNGLILLTGERLRRNAPVDQDGTTEVLEPVPATRRGASAEEETTRRPTRRLATLNYREAAIIGFFQTFALLAGISRSGISMVGARDRISSNPSAASGCPRRGPRKSSHRATLPAPRHQRRYAEKITRVLSDIEHRERPRCVRS